MCSVYMRFIAERVKKMAAVPEYFGSMVFDDRVMKANLSAEVYQSLKRTIDQGEKLNIGVANAVAAAIKDWAVAHGATHFTHWFRCQNSGRPSPAPWGAGRRTGSGR